MQYFVNIICILKWIEQHHKYTLVTIFRHFEYILISDDRVRHYKKFNLHILFVSGKCKEPVEIQESRIDH